MRFLSTTAQTSPINSSQNVDGSGTWLTCAQSSGGAGGENPLGPQCSCTVWLFIFQSPLVCFRSDNIHAMHKLISTPMPVTTQTCCVRLRQKLQPPTSSVLQYRARNGLKLATTAPYMKTNLTIAANTSVIDG